MAISHGDELFMDTNTFRRTVSGQAHLERSHQNKSVHVVCRHQLQKSDHRAHVGGLQNIRDRLATAVTNEGGNLSSQTVVLFGFKQIVCGNITELLLNSFQEVKRRTALGKINEI